jgi:hypothetical protein
MVSLDKLGAARDRPAAEVCRPRDLGAARRARDDGVRRRHTCVTGNFPARHEAATRARSNAGVGPHGRCAMENGTR